MDEQTSALLRYGGYALIAAGFGTVFAMAHHPTGAHSGPLGPLVHGAMIMFLGLMAFGFAAMASWRGVIKPLILAGALAFALSLFAHIGAATINGFAVPALAGRGDHVGHDVFLFAWELNQALAKLGVVATSGAILFWSLDFLGDRDRRNKLIGLGGLLAAVVPPALLLSGALRMNVAGAFLVYAVEAAWGVLVGVAMVWAARGMRSVE